MILLALLGAALGYVRKPTYTATSQLSVGQLNASDPAAVGSVVQASATLASVYSRQIDATEVRQNIRTAVGPSVGGSTVSATPIPESPLVKVTATGGSQRVAATVANAASRALTAYAAKYSDSSGGADTLYARFSAAALKYVQQQNTVTKLQGLVSRSPTTANQNRLNKAHADLQSALLLREGLRANYLTTRQNARTTPSLSIFALANSATSDRRSVMQVLGLLGLLAGAAVGAALATLRLNRRVARLTRP